MHNLRILAILAAFLAAILRPTSSVVLEGAAADALLQATTPAQSWLASDADDTPLLFKEVLTPAAVSFNVRLSDGKGSGTAATVTAPRGVPTSVVAGNVCDAAAAQLQGVERQQCVQKFSDKIDEQRKLPWTNPNRADVLEAGLLPYYLEVLALERHLHSLGHSISEGHTATCPAKVKVLWELVSNNPGAMNTLCEVGFNVGHSALAFLANSPAHVTLHSFDLGEYETGRLAREYLAAKFPGRVHFHLGPSQNRLLELVQQGARAGTRALTCDAMFVDGSHAFEGALQDLLYSRLLMDPARKHVVLFDDVNLASPRFQPKHSWQAAVDSGLLEPLGTAGCSDDHSNPYNDGDMLAAARWAS